MTVRESMVLDCARVMRLEADDPWAIPWDEHVGRIGWSYADPDSRDEFRNLIGPSWDLDRPFTQWRNDAGQIRTTGCSTCGLGAAGLLRAQLRLAGKDLPWPETGFGKPAPAPYGRLDIVSALGEFARLTGAKRTGHVPLPRPGDVCCVNPGSAAHVLVVVAEVDGVVYSVDAGQIDQTRKVWFHHPKHGRILGPLQCFKVCRRVWRGTYVHWVMDLEKVLSG